MAEVLIDWDTERFDKSRHDRSGFDCGEDQQNNFLATQVSQYRARSLGVTHVLVRKPEVRVYGFCTISMGAIERSALAPSKAKKVPQKVQPGTLLLGQLAVDKEFHRRGGGEALMMLVMKMCAKADQDMGCCGIVVDASNEKAFEYYEKMGFVSLEDGRRHMLLPIESIRKLNLLKEDPS